MNDWPDDELLMERFRDWLDEARGEADEIATADIPLGTPEFHAVGLYQVLEEFTALRHEVKLLTKSNRNLEQQTTDALAGLDRAAERFAAVEPDEAAAGREAAKPLVESLIDLDEALRRGRTALDNARNRLVEQSASQLRAELQQSFDSQSWWGRWRNRRWHEKNLAVCDRLAERHTELFESLATGYDLVQRRLRRALKEAKVFPITSVGQPVNPDEMTVLELGCDPLKPPGQVLEEIRRGYYWRGKVFRYAEVRANRS